MELQKCQQMCLHESKQRKTIDIKQNADMICICIQENTGIKFATVEGSDEMICL